MQYVSFRSLLSVLFAALSLTGCVSADPAVVKSMTLQLMQKKDYKLPNWFPIHKNPRVGDFAEYQGIDGSRTRAEILSQKGDLYEVANTFLKSMHENPAVAKTLEDIVTSCFVTTTGYCQEAYVFDKETGKRFPLQVAGPGDHFYVENPQLVVTEKPFEETIQTPVGEKKISQVMVLSTKVSVTGVSMNMTATYLMHQDVKFQVVRYRFVNAMKIQPVTVIRTLQNYAPGDPAQKWVIDMVLGKLENHEYETGSDLVRSN